MLFLHSPNKAYAGWVAKICFINERLRQGPVTDIHHRSPAYSFIYK